MSSGDRELVEVSMVMEVVEEPQKELTSSDEMTPSTEVAIATNDKTSAIVEEARHAK